MFESFVIMLREGIEGALVIGILLAALKHTLRRDLERSVFWGLGLAVLASVGAAYALSRQPIAEELYEGTLYWVSAAFVISMMAWMHVKSRTLSRDIEARVRQAVSPSAARSTSRERWALGAFAFLMIFREGAEAVLFLSAVHLTTDAMLGFLGSVLGLVAAIVFCVLFVQGSLRVDLRRFFTVTEWVLGIFVVQLAINGYHEFAEAGLLPATRRSMALVGPIVRNNSLFVLALVGIPLFIWMSRGPRGTKSVEPTSSAEKRLMAVRIRRDQAYRSAAVAVALAVLAVFGFVYAQEIMPRQLPPPEPVQREGDEIVIPLAALDDGRLHRLALATEGRTVRLLAMKTPDGRYRAALDACEICGAAGYVQEGKNLLCLNCAAPISPLTLGIPGGCNPIPLESVRTPIDLRVKVAALTKHAHLFANQSGPEGIDPVCGMHLKVSDAKGSETFQAETYYFCGTACQRAFRADPRAYVK